MPLVAVRLQCGHKIRSPPVSAVLESEASLESRFAVVIREFCYGVRSTVLFYKNLRSRLIPPNLRAITAEVEP